MLSYPLYIDDNMTRPTASITFVFTLIALIIPNMSWLMYAIFLDFTLRYIHPLYSPHTHFHRIIIYKLLHQDKKPSFSPPKRFAVLIGVIMTFLMSILAFFNIVILFQFIGIFMLIASGLQGFYNYCLGCTVYNWLIVSGFIKNSYNETVYVKKDSESVQKTEEKLLKLKQLLKVNKQ